MSYKKINKSSRNSPTVEQNIQRQHYCYFQIGNYSFPDNKLCYR